MCFIAFAFQCRDDCPLILAAGRDELYARLADLPARLAEGPAVIGGRDRQGGGTWLGVNEHGLVVAITNRAGEPYDGNRPTRGQIPLDALRLRCAADVRGWLESKLAADLQNPFNLLYADAREAFVTHAPPDAPWRTAAVSPGVHVLTNEHALDALRIPALDEIDFQGPVDESVDRLCELLSRSGEESTGYEIAKDRGTHGTVSATVIALHAGGIYRHAAGNPRRTPFEDHSHLMREIFAVPKTDP